MDQFQIEKDIQVMFLVSAKFPNDVPDICTKLEQIILDKKEKRYFGFSRPNKDGPIHFRAFAEILQLKKIPQEYLKLLGYLNEV